MKGTIYVLLSAVCFSTGGVLIKSIPWSSITIQGIRSIFSFMLIASYMVITKRKFVWNKTVLFGAVCNTAMALTFVSATKMTTAANAIGSNVEVKDAVTGETRSRPLDKKM